MALDTHSTIKAGPVTIADVKVQLGSPYPRHRSDLPGWGALIELPAVMQLLAAIEAGDITADQARAAFGPILADLADYQAEMDRFHRAMDDEIGGAR
ncbi:hypothetical protein SAMN06297387_12837 [Streptomyces zhaozhouensis]|uniref:Uncharacterized protein n=1 Tax=Streptomyces zhaozhouensis TaxID=1300267 RepID=A0A286E7Y3_9ACTN|nr:hypothetical protein [Streptomyces zhaozhouensis]SOD67025.1 hypothetical protein SAMN06297387_12837 [Streptomyces zhaozhouensis]